MPWTLRILFTDAGSCNIFPNFGHNSRSYRLQRSKYTNRSIKNIHYELLFLLTPQVDQAIFVTLIKILHFIYKVNVWDFTFVFQTFSKWNKKLIMKDNSILDLLYFVIIMCCFGLVSGTGRNKKGEIYIYVYIRRKGWKHTIDLLEKISWISKINWKLEN